MARASSRQAKVSIEKMSKNEARVAIAKDVIAQIRAKKYKAKNRTYVDFKPKTGIKKKEFFTEKDVETGKDLQDVIKTRMESCQVCAKGALFVSAIRKFDNFAVEDGMLYNSLYESGGASCYANNDDFLDHLRDYFDYDQLELMEYAFEGDCGQVDDYDQEERALAFYHSFKKAEDRLVAIMKNVIKNNGEFIPPKTQDQIEEEERQAEEESEAELANA